MRKIETKREMKPCPFCGSSEIIIQADNFSNNRLCECEYCGACGEMGNTIESAVKNWNKRYNDEKSQIAEKVLDKKEIYKRLIDGNNHIKKLIAESAKQRKKAIEPFWKEMFLLSEAFLQKITDKE